MHIYCRYDLQVAIGKIEAEISGLAGSELTRLVTLIECACMVRDLDD